MTEQPETLFNEQPEAPKPKAPGILEQIAGVFTDPVALFRRLNQTPTWGWALGAILVSAMVLTMVWAMKVDADEMLRPILERNPQITSAQIDTIIDMQKKFILPFSALGVIFGTPAGLALVGLFYWLIGKALPEETAPTYTQAFTAAVVPSLVKLPGMLLIAIICLVRPIGGLTPDKVAPTSLGYFIHVDGLKLQALLYAMDLFYLAEAGLAFLALRHLLRMKTAGAVICVFLPLVAGIGLRLMGAK